MSYRKRAVPPSFYGHLSSRTRSQIRTEVNQGVEAAYPNDTLARRGVRRTRVHALAQFYGVEPIYIYRALLPPGAALASYAASEGLFALSARFEVDLRPITADYQGLRLTPSGQYYHTTIGAS